MILDDYAHQILDDLVRIDGREESLRLAQVMRDMMAMLSEDRDFDDVGCWVIVSLNYALLLNYEESYRSVHIRWEKADRYKIFFDYCGSSDDNTFYGEFTEVPISQVAATLKDYLKRSKLKRGWRRSPSDV